MAKTSEVIREVYAQHPDWRPVDIAAEVARRTGKPCTSPQVASALKSKKAQAAQPSGLYQAPPVKEAAPAKQETAPATWDIFDAMEAMEKVLSIMPADDAQKLLERMRSAMMLRPPR